MAIERLNRIRWRLRESGKPEIPMADLRIAIMKEAGTDSKTIKNTIAVMLELKLIIRKDREFGQPDIFTLGDDADC